MAKDKYDLVDLQDALDFLGDGDLTGDRTILGEPAHGFPGKTPDDNEHTEQFDRTDDRTGESQGLDEMFSASENTSRILDPELESEDTFSDPDFDNEFDEGDL